MGSAAARGRAGDSGGGRSFSNWWKGAVIAALLIEMVVVVVAIRNEPSPPPSSAVDHRSTGAEQAENLIVNEAGGYSFAAPEGWKLDQDGSITRVESPDGETIVTIAEAPAGDVLGASDELLAAIEENYPSFRVNGRSVDRAAGALAIEVRGRVTNSSHAPLRFHLVVVEGQEQNLGITAFSRVNDVEHRDETEDAIDSLSFDLPQG